MARIKKTTTRKKKKPARRFQFQLGFAGVAGVAVVMFCLFLWMFLLGIWAGQTILLPSTTKDTTRSAVQKKEERAPVRILRPQKSKTPVSQKSSLAFPHHGGQSLSIFLKSRTIILNA